MENLLRKVYNSKKISLALRTVSHIATAVAAILYAALLVLGFIRGVRVGISLMLFAGIPFILVDVFRRIINAKRPYELYDFYECPPKKREGRSFPSRHAYSAFVIATLAFAFSIPAGIVMACLGLALCVSRVLLGIHFIRDVLCGAAVGIIAGVLGLLLI